MDPRIHVRGDGGVAGRTASGHDRNGHPPPRNSPPSFSPRRTLELGIQPITNYGYYYPQGERTGVGRIPCLSRPADRYYS